MGVTFCVAPIFFGGFRPAGRGARSVLSSDGKNQRSPGDGSYERLRAAGAHSHLSPGPPFTKADHFGRAVNSGGQNQDRFPSYSRPTGACCHPNLTALRLYHTPPPASLPVWCGGGRAANGACPNTDQLPQLFCTRRCHFNGISFKIQIYRP